MIFKFDHSRFKAYKWDRWSSSPTYNNDLKSLATEIAKENGVVITEWLDYVHDFGINSKYVRLDDGKVYSLFLGDDFLDIELSLAYN